MILIAVGLSQVGSALVCDYGEDLSRYNEKFVLEGHEAIGFEGRLAWDLAKPDAMPRKLLERPRLSCLVWSPRLGLREGGRCLGDDLLRQGPVWQ